MASTDEIVHKLAMRWADLDSLNHVNNVAYLEYAAESRARLVDDGELAADVDVSAMSVRYSRPLLLTRQPVLVVSVVDADTVTQHICTENDGVRTVFATVTTTLGTPSPAPRTDVGGEPLPSRIRRSDVDTTGWSARPRHSSCSRRAASCSSPATWHSSARDSSSSARSVSTSTGRSVGGAIPISCAAGSVESALHR